MYHRDTQKQRQTRQRSSMNQHQLRNVLNGHKFIKLNYCFLGLTVTEATVEHRRPTGNTETRRNRDNASKVSGIAGQRTDWWREAEITNPTNTNDDG